MVTERWRKTLQLCFEAIRVLFQINVEDTPPTDTFPYLGRTIAYNNSDWSAVYHNLRNAQRRWVMIARVLMKTVSTVRSRGVMYNAVVQLLLLYRSDIWVVTGGILKVLEGFRHRAIRWITWMTTTRGVCGEW